MHCEILDDDAGTVIEIRNSKSMLERYLACCNATGGKLVELTDFSR